MSAFNNIAQNTYSANKSILDETAQTNGDDENNISENEPVIKHVNTSGEPYQRKVYHKNP